MDENEERDDSLLINLSSVVMSQSPVRMKKEERWVGDGSKARL
jgi:hypothetical protein